jgi:hypothetical protein
MALAAAFIAGTFTGVAIVFIGLGWLLYDKVRPKHG